jgi:hypothetical protein
VYKLPKVLNNKDGNGGGVGGDNNLQFLSDIFTHPVVPHAHSDTSVDAVQQCLTLQSF